MSAREPIEIREGDLILAAEVSKQIGASFTMSPLTFLSLMAELDQRRRVMDQVGNLAGEWICCPGEDSCVSQSYSDALYHALDSRNLSSEATR